jgi:hypothetical protein
MSNKIWERRASGINASVAACWVSVLILSQASRCVFPGLTRAIYGSGHHIELQAAQAISASIRMYSSQAR